MPFRASAIAIGCLTAIACDQGQAQASRPVELQISVLRDGSLKVDGQVADIAALAAALDRTKAEGGDVAYYREGGDETPSPELQGAIASVLGAVFERELPIRMSSKPDFSDNIDDQGRSHPYTPKTKGAQ